MTKGQTEIEINRLISVLSRTGGLLPSQVTRLSQAISDAAMYSDTENSFQQGGIAVIGKYLQAQEKAAADNAFTKLRPLFSYNLIQDGDDFKTTGIIYEIDINGLPASDQDLVANFLIEYLLDDILSKRFTKDGGLTLYIDEAHNYCYSKDSALFHLLNESRKTDTNLILVTTSFGDKAPVVNQAHFRVSFKTGSRKEVEEIATSADHMQRPRIRVTLPSLPVGKCLLIGDFIRCNKQGIPVDNEISHFITGYTYIPAEPKLDNN